MYNLSHDAHTVTCKARWEAEVRQLRLAKQAKAPVPVEQITVNRTPGRFAAIARSLSQAVSTARRASA